MPDAADAGRNGRLSKSQVAIARAYDRAWKLVSVLPLPPGQMDALKWRHEQVKNGAVAAAGRVE